MRSQYPRKQSKAFREESIRLHGAVCCNCESSENIEWHHALPLELGGNDIPRNCIPLCRLCHKAVTNYQLVILTRQREWKMKNAGRKVLVMDDWDEIFLDYVECRISQTEAAERLGGRKSFRSLKAFSDFKERHGIVHHRNNIETILKFHERVPYGSCVGTIEYSDGTKKRFHWYPEDD